MPSLPIKPEYERMWAFNYFAARMLQYMAKHKDPFFEDERETRIIGVPAKTTQPRPFIGLALVKKIGTTPNGRQFIGIGEDWTPGLEPRRIIIGPHADKNIDDVTALFQNKPEIVIAEFPV